MIRFSLSHCTRIAALSAILGSSILLLGCPDDNGSSANSGNDLKVTAYFMYTATDPGYMSGHCDPVLGFSDGSGPCPYVGLTTKSYCFKSISYSPPKPPTWTSVQQYFDTIFPPNAFFSMMSQAEQNAAYLLPSAVGVGDNYVLTKGSYDQSAIGLANVNNGGCQCGGAQCPAPTDSLGNNSLFSVDASQLPVDGRSTLSIVGGTGTPTMSGGVTYYKSTACTGTGCTLAIFDSKFVTQSTMSNSTGSVNPGTSFEQIGSLSVTTGQNGVLSVNSGDAVFNLSGSGSANGNSYNLSGGYTVDATGSSGTFDLLTGTANISLSLKPITSGDLPAMVFHLVSVASSVRGPNANAGPDKTVECNPQTKTGPVPLTSSASIAGTSPIAKTGWIENGQRIVLDASSNANLALGTHTLTLNVIDGNGLISGDQMTATVQDTTAPIIQLTAAQQNIDACSTAALTIPTPSTLDCTATTVTGQVVMRDGVAVSEPFSGTIPAYPGKTTIRWTAKDANGNTSTADQVINVSPSLTGTQYVYVDDRAVVYNHGTTFGPVLGGKINIGVASQVGDIFSPGQVNLADRAYVWGNIYTPITPHKGNGITFPGSVINQTPTLPVLPAVTVVPGSNDITVNSGVASPAPGAYRNANVNSGGTLSLSPGVYSFATLTLNTGATLKITPSSTQTVIQVQSGAAIRGLTPTNIDPATLQIKVAGSNPVYIEPNFTGSVLAPNANVTVGVGSGSTFSGSIRAASIELRPDIKYYCLVN